MTGFADLPNELIIDIWCQVLDPNAVESFALTSKRIYALGRNFIKEHNELKAKFSSIVHRQGGIARGSAPTLMTLLRNPRIALYVRELSVDWWRSTAGGSHDHWQTRLRPYFNDITNLFRPLIKDSPPFSEGEIVSWLGTIEAGNENAVFPLLLTMLPNMQSLKVNGNIFADTSVFHRIKRITECRNAKALSRLTEVRLDAAENLSMFEEFHWVRMFATLPSVKVIKGWNTSCACEFSIHDYFNDSCIHCGPNGNYDYDDTVWQKRQLLLLPKTSAVTHLTFIDCILNPGRLSRFLEGLHTLESFEYRSIQGDFQPRELVDVLLVHAKHSLQKLRLRSGGGCPSDTVTLADFEVMKELETEYDVLLDNRARGDPMDMLPPLIEKVHLSCLTRKYAKDEVECDVLEMTEWKAERFPNLRELSIDILPYLHMNLNADTIPTMKQKCEDVGIQLSVRILSDRTPKWSIFKS